MQETVGDRIRRLRERAGVSSTKLCRLADLSEGHVHRLENGKRAKPTIDTLARLAIALGADISWLAYGKGREPSAEETLTALDHAFIRLTNQKESA